MMKRYALRWLAGLLALPLLAACAGQAADEVETTYDHQFDFSVVRGVYLEPFSRTDPATIAVSDAQIKRINDAIAAELQRKGFAVVADAARADLLITWYLNTREGTPGGSTDCPGCGADAGGDGRSMLVVDMTSIMSNQPVWRSVLKTTLHDESDAAKTERERRHAARAVFADFPPNQAD